jgi:hypothetical protein
MDPGNVVNKGFFVRLFDLSFSDFVTTKIVSLLYIIAIILAGLLSLAMLSNGLNSRSGWTGVASLISAPLFFFLFVLLARIWLEAVVVVFRIADNTSIMARVSGRGFEHEDEPKEGSV